MSGLIVFVGPSLAHADARRLARAELRPPARQGDVWRALTKRPRAIALIDGVFEAVPSVWHKELLDALGEGVAVFGASSMGALRAAELDTLGMVGIGRVYGWLKDGTIEDDAEVALLHGPAETGFRAMTVPHVNVRYAAEQVVRSKVLSKSHAARLERLSAATFYKERTWPRLLKALPATASDALARWIKSADVDIKRLDAIACIQAAAEFARAGVERMKVRLPLPSSLVRRSRRAVQGPAASLLSEQTLLAEWARSMGAAIPEPEIERRMKSLARRSPGSRSELRLAAERELLAEWSLANASRLLPDLGGAS